MHTGREYKFSEFLFWTRRTIYWLLILSIVPPVLYEVFGWKWIAIPFTIIGLLGTATAFIITFRNQETHNRTREARQIWGATMSASRAWAMMCRDFLENREHSQELIYRHLAWLTALRYQLRTSRDWENLHKRHNREYKKYYAVPEWETALEQELAKYISKEEVLFVLAGRNPATRLLGLQSEALKRFRQGGTLDEFRFLNLHDAMCEFSNHQGRSERIKNFPYPRQYATINGIFVKLFCVLLPFSLLEEFDKLNTGMTGILQGYMVWLVVPFSVLISWVFTSLEQVGESTENPFEGSANDVPISQLSRAAEIDIREMMGEADLPPAIQPRNNIVL